jgi:hypothetical protein
MGESDYLQKLAHHYSHLEVAVQKWPWGLARLQKEELAEIEVYLLQFEGQDYFAQLAYYTNFPEVE